MLYDRFPLSLRTVEDLLHERGIEASDETGRIRYLRFGPTFAPEVRKRQEPRCDHICAAGNLT